MSRRNRGKQKNRGIVRQPREVSPADGSPADATLSRSSVRFTQMSYQGPLPHPQVLREFNEIVPGAAERILTTFEQQVKHRIAIESTVISGDAARSYLGLYFGLIAVLVGFGIVGYGFSTGNAAVAAAAAAFGGFELAALAKVFVTGYRGRQAEREQRRKVARK